MNESFKMFLEALKIAQNLPIEERTELAFRFANALLDFTNGKIFAPDKKEPNEKH